MALTRAEIRTFIQGLQQQQPPLSAADLRAAIIEKWLDDRGDVGKAGVETQTSTTAHLIRVRKVTAGIPAPGDPPPFVWSILHPAPDPLGTAGDPTSCPFNRVGTDNLVGVPDHRGYFVATLSADLTQIIIGVEVNP
jgi:hypothetical protein